MKENITLILLVAPLALLVWLGMRVCFDRGKPTPWVPAPVAAKKTKKEKQLATPEADGE